MSRKKRMMYFFAVLAVLFTLTVVVAYINDAPFRWSRNLCEAIRVDDTDTALQLIDDGKIKGYSMDTLSERPSFIWTLLESSPKTPLQAACQSGNSLVVQRLLEEGASVQPVQGGLSTDPVLCVLHRPYAPEDLQIIQLLLDYGTESYGDFVGCSFVPAAAFRAPRNFSASPDPNTGKYPYDEAAAKGITDVVMLLSQHCDIYAVDGADRNALHCAVLMHNWHLVELLTTDFHFSLTASDVNGKTAYDLAQGSDAPQDILDLLKP